MISAVNALLKTSGLGIALSFMGDSMKSCSSHISSSRLHREEAGRGRPLVQFHPSFIMKHKDKGCTK